MTASENGGHIATAPVFTVGSPRSGTTLLYHMLLSAGGFVRYRTETHVFSTLAPRFRGLRVESDRRAALAVWLASDCHKLSGLPEDVVHRAVQDHVHGAGDFLRVIMETMARRQGAVRWAESTPAHALHMAEIASEIPDALFVHVVRDGRDVAASLARQGWIRPFPFDRDRPSLAAAAFWSWIVGRCRRQGHALGARCLEVRYEDLIDAPEVTLRRLGAFVRHDLDWERIRRVGIGSVSRPNSSFPASASAFKGRWKSELEPRDAGQIDAMLRARLHEFGYASEAEPSADAGLRRMLYAMAFSTRDWVKRHTPLGSRITDLGFFAPGSMSITPEKLAGLDGSPSL